MTEYALPAAEEFDGKISATNEAEAEYLGARFPEFDIDPAVVAIVVRYHSDFQGWKKESGKAEAMRAERDAERAAKNADRDAKKLADAIALLEAAGIAVPTESAEV